MKWKVLSLVCITAAIIEISLLIMKVGFANSIILSSCITIGGYLCWWLRKSKKINDILEEEYDPERFIEEYQKIKTISNKKALQGFCNGNIAVGYSALGRNAEALDILTHDIDLLAMKNKINVATLHLAFFCCYLNIGDLEKAMFEYNTHITKLRKSIVHPKLMFSIDASVLEYHYQINKTPETARIALEQLNYLYHTYSKKISKRIKLNVNYNQAEFLLALGDYEGAARKYNVVADNGKNLWIAEMSRKKLVELAIQNKQHDVAIGTTD